MKIGPACYIKGANKLKNLTINSSEDEPTQIGEGVELVNGIVGLGCHVFYGCKAVRFVMGNNSNLKYGARLIHSYLGDNSTVSCCELLNNLIFPGPRAAPQQLVPHRLAGDGAEQHRRRRDRSARTTTAAPTTARSRPAAASGRACAPR